MNCEAPAPFTQALTVSGTPPTVSSQTNTPDPAMMIMIFAVIRPDSMATSNSFFRSISR